MLKFMGKTLVMIVLAALLVVACQNLRHSGNTPLPLSQAQPDALRLASYNVHYIILSEQTGAWSVGDWDRRKRPLDEAFKALGADVVAFQEMESFQRGSDGAVNLARDWLMDNNSDYGLAASGPWEEFPPTQPMLFRKDRLKMLDQGWFFFSDTPDAIYSRTFNGSYPAFASWAQFRDLRTEKMFRIVNIHTDYKSGENRLKSVALVAERIAPWQAENETVFVTGDFNALRGSKTHAILEDRGMEFAPIEGSTYHANYGLNLFGAIDHLAFTEGVALDGAPMVLRTKFRGVWPTDHYPVAFDVLLP